MPKPLTIGVDIRDLKKSKTGIKTYLEELCREFKKLNNNNNICFHFLDTSIPVYIGDNNKVVRLIEHVSYQAWKQLVLPLKAFNKNCDILFCVDNVVPLLHLGYKTIPVFHDAFFFENPENYGKLWLWWYKKTAIPAAKRSLLIITPTVYAKKQINHFTGIANNKLLVVHEGPKTFNDTDIAENANELLQSFSITKSNYILHVGSVYKRKNIPNLIYAFSNIKKTGYPHLKLVLAGSSNSSNTDNAYGEIIKAIEATQLQNEVILTGYLADKDLALLYKNALIYVFPSTNEGFGIPVLEAFKYNLPVLVANNTCLPEVGGDAVLAFDPFNTDNMTEKIKDVLDNAKLRQEMIAKGKERLKEFSWNKTALQLIEAFKKTANYS